MKLTKLISILMAAILLIGICYSQRRSGGFRSSSGFGSGSARSSSSTPKSSTSTPKSSSSFGGSKSSSSTSTRPKSGSTTSKSSPSSSYKYSKPPGKYSGKTTTEYTPDKKFKVGEKPNVQPERSVTYNNRTVYVYPGGGYSYDPMGTILGYMVLSEILDDDKPTQAAATTSGPSVPGVTVKETVVYKNNWWTAWGFWIGLVIGAVVAFIIGVSLS